MPRPMKAFVTGGAGFIGSNLVDALVERGDAVEVLDDLSTGKRENLERAAAALLHEADLRDAERVAALVEAAAPDVIFHLGAQIDVRRAVADPAFDAAVNVGRDDQRARGGPARGRPARRELLHRRRDLRRRRHDPDRRGHDAGADGAVRPEQARGRGLLRAVRAAARAVGGLAALRERLRAAPGPARRGRRGGDLLRQAASSAARRWRSATGSRRATTCTSATSWPRTSPPPARTGRAPATSGTGVETTVIELADALRALDGSHPFALEHAPERPGEIVRSAVDPALAREALGWEARVGAGRGARAHARLDPRLTAARVSRRADSAANAHGRVAAVGHENPIGKRASRGSTARRPAACTPPPPPTRTASRTPSSR